MWCLNTLFYVIYNNNKDATSNLQHPALLWCKGMRHDDVPDMFGRVLSGTKYGVKQARGRFGLGAKMALIWSKMTTAGELQIFTAQPKRAKVTECRLDIDLHKNEYVPCQMAICAHAASLAAASCVVHRCWKKTPFHLFLLLFLLFPPKKKKKDQRF